MPFLKQTAYCAHRGAHWILEDFIKVPDTRAQGRIGRQAFLHLLIKESKHGLRSVYRCASVLLRSSLNKSEGLKKHHKDTNNARCKAKFNGNHGRNKEKSTVHTVPPFKPLQFLTGLIWTAILAVQPSDPVDIWLTSLLIATDSRSWTTADTETWTEKTFTFRSVDKSSCATSIESIARVYPICQTPTFLKNPQRIPPIQPTSCDRPSETGEMGETSEKGAWAIALSRPGTGIVQILHPRSK